MTSSPIQHGGNQYGIRKRLGLGDRPLIDFSVSLNPLGPPPSVVAAARRDYFLTVQHGANSSKTLTRDDIPGFGDELEGLPYFPRILAKANAKLRGELDRGVKPRDWLVNANALIAHALEEDHAIEMEFIKRNGE